MTKTLAPWRLGNAGVDLSQCGRWPEFLIHLRFSTQSLYADKRVNIGYRCSHTLHQVLLDLRIKLESVHYVLYGVQKIHFVQTTRITDLSNIFDLQKPAGLAFPNNVSTLPVWAYVEVSLRLLFRLPPCLCRSSFC